MDRESLEQTVIQTEPLARKRDKTPQASVDVPVGRLEPLMRQLRDREPFSFDMLCCHTAVDWLAEDKFELIYHLYSTKHGHYLMISCMVGRDSQAVPTMGEIWPIAHWQEREVYDLFGVLYEGHSDLRRVFLDDDWQGHPLRKDYKDPGMLEFSV